MKMQDLKMKDQIAGPEKAGPEIEGPSTIARDGWLRGSFCWCVPAGSVRRDNSLRWPSWASKNINRTKTTWGIPITPHLRLRMASRASTPLQTFLIRVKSACYNHVKVWLLCRVDIRGSVAVALILSHR